MQQTPNLLLKLPEPTDFVQVEDLNENFTKIDTEIAKITDEETGVEAKLAKHLDDNTKHITDAERAKWNGGSSNADVTKTKSVLLQVDTRELVLTYTGDRLTRVEEKDGTVAVKTTTLTYNVDGTLNKTQEVAGGTTVTKTLGYTSGKLSNVTKVVS